MDCVDTSSDEPLDAELNEKVYQAAALVSHDHDCRFSIVRTWKIIGESFLFERTRQDDFERLRNDVPERIKTLLDTFLQRHDRNGEERNVRMIEGDAVTVIPAFANENGVDLVVMGTVARSGLAGMDHRQYGGADSRPHSMRRARTKA